jgi:hypothetical protein
MHVVRYSSSLTRLKFAVVKLVFQLPDSDIDTV